MMKKVETKSVKVAKCMQMRKTLLNTRSLLPLIEASCSGVIIESTTRQKVRNREYWVKSKIKKRPLINLWLNSLMRRYKMTPVYMTKRVFVLHHPGTSLP